MRKDDVKDHDFSPLLPVNITPYEFESCNGYIIRVAEANGYPSPRWIVELEPILKSPQYQKKKDIENALIRLVGLSRHETMFLNQSLLCRRHVSAAFYSNKAKICPECLKNNKYLDFMWEVAFASACPYHGIQLIDSCPECLCKLSWDRVPLEYCPCGADLTRARTVPANERLLYYNTKMWSAMGRKVPSITLEDVHDEMLNKHELSMLCKIYRFFYRAGIKQTTVPHFRTMTVAELVDVFEVINPKLADWPFGLYRFFDSLRSENGLFDGEGLHQAFGVFYKRLYNKSEEFKFVDEAFEAYVSSNWIGVIDGKYRSELSHLSCKYASVGTVSKKLKICRLRLNKLIDLGVVSGHRKLRPSGRRYTLLNRFEVKKLAMISKYMINKKETCSLMGITKRVFDTLVAAKTIKPLVTAGDYGFSEWWCDKRKIQAFLEKIVCMVPKHEPSIGAISFAQMCQAHLTNINLVPDLLQSIISGKIQVAGIKINKTIGEFRLSNLHFDPDEIARFRQDYKKKHSFVYSIPETALMMGIKQQVAYHLVNAGFMKFQEDTSGIKKGRVTSRDAILDFEKIYIPLVDIARSKNICPRTLLITFNRLSISPAIGGGIDGCRQVFYRRSDLPKPYNLKIVDVHRTI